MSDSGARGPQAELPVRRGVAIPAAEIHESASRSGGAGGQHVNKTETRVTLRWSPLHSRALGERQRARVLEALASRLTAGGELVVHAGRARSRARNREAARARLAELVREALEVPATRVPTRATRASRERMLRAKRERSRLKRQRGPVRPEE